MAASADLALIDAHADWGRDAIHAAFRRDVLEGLAQPRKAIPARWFYDDAGSQLFEDITRLPEYYPTRAETEILAERCHAIGDLVGPGRVVVEFGAGSATKTPLLLGCIAPAAYVPIDISGEFLRESCAPLAERFPNLPIVPVEGDFTRPFTVPEIAPGAKPLGFFPGSTIGNLAPAPAADLLRAMRATLGGEAMLVIGMDMVKDVHTLLTAYDDPAGVTAAFNRNLLARINRELGGAIPVEAFAHRAVWNDALARVEMHLEATRDLAFRIGERTFTMARGETIHTENSHKYTVRSATMLLLAGGWNPLEVLYDRDRRFMVIVAEASAGGISA